MDIFFTSDPHFGHANIIKFCNRPFADVQEMNAKLIENWNNKVKKNDQVYILGDFALGSEKMALQILERLNGKLHLIKGNHEKAVLNKEYTRAKFEWIKDYFEMKVDINGKSQFICMFHYPIQSWNRQHHGSWQLHGHCHNTIESPGILRLDVGVDNPLANFAPFSLEEINTIMLDKLNNK